MTSWVGVQGDFQTTWPGGMTKGQTGEGLMIHSAAEMEQGWQKILAGEFRQPHMEELQQFLQKEEFQNQEIYPQSSEYFAAFKETPFKDVKVVIIGQDPYHGPGQAHGLCFSVRPAVKIPPSLVNIYKEMESDLGIPRANHGHLTSWAQQGVLLLNATLTVRAGQAGSHQKRGWEEFTDAVIEKINGEKEGVAFILWGSYAQKKGKGIDFQRHFVHKGPHPSPLSAHRGFFGSRPFSKVNDYLKSQGKTPINWELPSNIT